MSDDKDVPVAQVVVEPIVPTVEEIQAEVARIQQEQETMIQGHLNVFVPKFNTELKKTLVGLGAKRYTLPAWIGIDLDSSVPGNPLFGQFIEQVNKDLKQHKVKMTYDGLNGGIATFKIVPL